MLLQHNPFPSYIIYYLTLYKVKICVTQLQYVLSRNVVFVSVFLGCALVVRKLRFILSGDKICIISFCISVLCSLFLSSSSHLYIHTYLLIYRHGNKECVRVEKIYIKIIYLLSGQGRSLCHLIRYYWH